ncbi:hypothetical protein D3C71_1407780 [compost metagenome]
MVTIRHRILLLQRLLSVLGDERVSVWAAVEDVVYKPQLILLTETTPFSVTLTVHDGTNHTLSRCHATQPSMAGLVSAEVSAAIGLNTDNGRVHPPPQTPVVKTLNKLLGSRLSGFI